MVRAAFLLLLLLNLSAHSLTIKQITRVPAASMTRARLDAAIAAGELLVIEGGARGWRALDEWSLSWFEARFPNASIEFRHDGSTGPEALRASAGLQLGNHRAATRAYGRPWYAGWGNQDAAVGARDFAPFLAPTPAWFPAAFAAQGFRTEWLYFGSFGSGAAMHIDPQCHPKWSAHISGVKRWRLRERWRRALRRGADGAFDDAAEDGDEDDEDGEEGADAVEWRADVVQGDIVLFYPQFHHATDVLSRNGSLSYTNYFVSPRDTPFIRELIRAGRRDASFRATYGKCYRAGATLDGMGRTCALCAETQRGFAMRPELCDRPNGVKMCADLAAGRIVEDELPWDETEGRAPAREKPRGEPMRMTFSAPQEAPNY